MPKSNVSLYESNATLVEALGGDRLLRGGRRHAHGPEAKDLGPADAGRRMKVHGLVSDAVFAQRVAPLAATLDRVAVRRLASVEDLLATVPRDDEPDLFVVEASLLPQEAGRRAAVLRRPRLILLTAADTASTIRVFAENDALRHVQPIHDAPLGRRLETTLLQLGGDGPMPLANYLGVGASLQSTTVASSRAKRVAIEAIGAGLRTGGCFAELAGLVATVASELLTNAIFNAPHDLGLGLPKYRDQSREDGLSLAAGEEVRVSFGQDEGHVIVSVEDRFGRLSRATLAANLLRSSSIGSAQIKVQTAGAGVGLYMVMSSTTQLDVFVERGKLTRITAVIGLSKRYRDFERLGHSLSFFGRD